MRGRMAMIALMVVPALCLTGCPKSGPEPSDANETTAGQLQQKADKALQASTDYLTQQKDRLVEASREQLGKLEEDFNTWVDKIDTEDDQIRQELDQLSGRFETALGRARQTIDKAGELGLEAWRDAKPNLEAALGEAREAYDEFIAFVRTQADQTDPTVEE